ncbi:IclR family transcriptional regulator [Paludibacterium purpuratum]|uniref:IclR family transcriptional regulator n=1 Tax=Paludibacterium purpuratum TaxID=1144873 RepID=A0A4V6PZ84_9NEIS|nr:IclR family transcriptional regulator [Paludibacterium purpuratum]TDR78487.1 IclR family transcriptional regulator [Paludibacterium purpuratum]
MTNQSLADNVDFEPAQDRHFVTALARGLQVLAAFRPGEGALSNQQLAARTGLPKSTVSRLSYTLTRLGYLAQDAETGGYRPGLAALSLAGGMLGSFDMRRVAAPLMRAFSLEHTISASLGLLDGTDIVYLETCRSQARVSVQLSVGSRVPLATTAIGRACYAGLPPAEQQALRSLLKARYGEGWPTHEARLAAACDEYRRYGFCTSFGEFEPDVMAVGVALPPLTAGQGAMCLNASGPAFAFDEKEMAGRIGPALLALRDQIMPRG